MAFETHDEVFSLLYCIFCGIGIPLNTLTLYLVVFKSRKVMASYRLFLANSTFASLLLNLILICIQPKLFPVNNIVAAVLLGWNVDEWICFGLNTVALVCVCYEFVAMSGSFLYRYLVLCHKDFATR